MQHHNTMTTTTNIRIKFTAAHLPHLALFMAKQDLRYYLMGIGIEPAPQGGVYLVATDGHCLTVIHDKDGTMTGGESVILRASPELVSACKKRYEPGLNANIIITGQRVSIANDFDQEHTDLETYIQPGKPWIEANFPNWRRLMPDFTKLVSGFRASVNSHYLAKFAKLASEKNGNCGLIFWQEPSAEPYESKAVIVQHVDRPEMITVVMPMRQEKRDTEASRSLFQQFPQKVTEPA